MNFLLIGGIFFLAFLLRTLLHFKYQWIGLDAFTHLLCALKIRKSKSLFRGRECIIDDYAGHQILSSLLSHFFWIWGDGYRYLTNAVFPASILAAVFLERLPASNLFFNLLLLASFMGTGYIFWKFVNSRRVIKNEFIRCCNYIRKKAKKKDTLAVFFTSKLLVYWCLFHSAKHLSSSLL